MAMVTMMTIQVVGVSPETGEVIRSRVRNLEELKVVETMINVIIILIIIIMIMKVVLSSDTNLMIMMMMMMMMITSRRKRSASSNEFS